MKKFQPSSIRICMSSIRAGIASLALCAPALAQTVAPAPAPARTEEEVVELPTFSVQAEKDEGYIAADTISGSRLSTNLIKTPSDVTTLTAEFIRDLGVFDTREVLRWLTSAHPTDPSPTDPRDFGGNVNFRGLPSGGNTRNYFPYIITVKDYLVERVEGWRGPNAILYGTGPIGGSVNILTKQPRYNSNQGMFDFRMDTADTLRLALDDNRKISRHAALRLNGITQKRHTFIKGYVDDLDAIDAAVAVRPWRRASLRVEGEIGKQVNSMGYGAVMDRSSLWDGVTTVSGAVATLPTGSGLTRLGNSYLVASNAWEGVLSFQNYPRTNGTSLSVANAGDPDLPAGLGAKMPVIPRKEFWLAPPQVRLKNNYHTVQAFFEQQFDWGLVFEFAASTARTVREGPTYNWMSTYVDVVDTLPNGEPNVHGFKKYYSEVTLNNDYRTLNANNTARLAAAYPFRIGRAEQTISIVAQRNTEHFEPVVKAFGRDNNPEQQDLRDAVNRYMYRMYWDQPASFVTPLDSNGYTFSEVLERDTYQTSQMNSIQANFIGEYFRRGLTIIGGFRYDDYFCSITDIATRDARGNPDTYTTQRFGAKVRTGSAGLTWFPIHAAGLYVNYSEGFRPLNRNVPALPGEAGVNATDSNSKTAGLRFRLFKNRVIGSAGYYTSAEKNQTQQLGIGEANSIWQLIGMENKQVVHSQYLDTYDYSAHGFEVDITANLTKRWRLKFNAALPKNKISNAYPGSRRYWEANRVEWEAAKETVPQATATLIESHMTTFYNRNVLAGTEGRKINGSLKWTANFFTTYSFDRGFLKGFQFGGGANFYGDRLIGNEADRAFDYIYNKSYVIASAMLRYDFKIKKMRFETQLNVSNLLDNDDPVFTNVLIYGGKAYRNNYYYIPAREVMFSLRLRY
jgi:outer membrane receptor protein involved in Fe transport